MDRYPLGRDIHVSWSLDLDGQDINLSECTFFFAYKAAGGSRFVPANQYTVSNDTLQWTFAGEDQFAYGVYSLHLVVFSDGEPVAEFKNDYAFEIIHGAVSDQPQSVALESSVETTQDDFPEPDDEPSDEPAEYHSSSPLYMEKIPLGSNIVLNWNLLTPETFDFDLTECELRLYYTASGSGFKRAHDYELKTESGYTIQWNFAGSEQTRYGIYSLFLEVYNDGLIAVLEREYAFELVHRNGSDLADRIISFDSIVTSFGGGALFSLIDVLNDGHSTVYRGDGETPAAAGDVLQFDGEKWHATQAGNLDAIQALNSDVAALWVDSRGIHTRVEDAEGNISSLEQTAEGFDLRVASVEGNVGELTLTAEEFETRISDAEGNISTLEQTAESLTSSIEDAEGNISVLQQTAESLTSAISDAEGNISVLQQTAAGLESRVEDAEDNISTISQTAESIQLQVDSQSGDIATLQVSARGLTSRVSNAEGDISTLDQRADAIEVSVQGLSTEITRYEGVTDAALRNMQDQIDGVIETWYYNGVPTLNNLPASQWSAAEMANHVGDLYYDKNTGKAYRFMLDNTQTPAVYVWVELADEDIAKALALAGEKKRVFVTTPYAPYDAGDLWVRQKTVGGNTVNEIWRCKTSRAADASPSFLESEWESADNFGYVVNKSNLEVLSDAIVGQVTQITYNTDGTVSTEAKSAIEANARSVRISTVVDNVAYAGISIDSTNHTGSVTIFSDNFYVKAPQGNKTALSIINLPNGNSVIDVASLNVNGIFTTSAWTSEESALQGYADAAAGDAQSAAEGYADTAAGNAQTAAEGYADTKAGEAETNAKNYANSTAYLNEHVLPMIQQETSGLAVDSDYSYLKTALENRTTALGGLMLTSLIQLGATQSGSSWTVNSGISGIYDSTKRGNGIAAWFGGPMVDHLASPATTPYAATLFRMDGSGYLAGGEIQWGASGELIIHGTSAATPITIENAELKDGNKTLSVGDLILNIEDLLELKSWFVKETYDPGDGQTHYRLKLVGSSTGIEGLHVEGHILSDDDQIVGGGTPGGGGGGAGYLYELGDVYASGTNVLRADGTARQAGDALVYNSTHGWVAAPVQASGNYLPLSAGSSYPLTGALYVGGTFGDKVVLETASGGDNWCNILYWPSSGKYWSVGAGADTFYWYKYASGETSGTIMSLDRSGYLTAAGFKVGTSTGFLKANGTVDTTAYVPTTRTVNGKALSANITLSLEDVADGSTRKLANYLPLAGGNMTGSIWRKMNADTSNYEDAIGFKKKADNTVLATIGYYNTVQRVFINPIGSSDVYSDEVGKYSLVIGNNFLTYNTYSIYHAGNSNKSDVAWTCSYLTVGEAAQTTFRAKITGATGSSTTSLVGISNTADYQWTGILSGSAPNLTAGHNITMGIGVASSTRNSGSMQFYYAGSGSTSNAIGLGLYGVDYILSCFGSGNVAIGYGTTDNGYKLDVNGTAHVSSHFSVGTGLAQVNAGRAELSVVSATDVPTDIMMGAGGEKRWSISSRDSGASNMFSLYSYTGAAHIATVTHSGNIGIGLGLTAASYKIEVSGTSSATITPMMMFKNTSDYAWTSPASFLAPNLTASHAVTVSFGRAASTKNLGALQFYYAGSSSNSNLFGLGLYGVDWALTVSGQSYVGIGYGTTAPSYRLDINSGSVGEAMRIASSTYVCMGYKPGSGASWFVGANTSSQYYFWNSSASAVVSYFTSSGSLVTSGDQVISSDINLKTNLAPVTYGVEDIAKTRAVTFDWKDGRGKSAGSIAQDWKPLIPELVHGEEGNMTLAYGQIALVNTIIEAREIDVLKKRVAELEAEVQRLRMN